MSSVVPSSYPAIDSERFLRGREILGGTGASTSDYKALIEGQNYTFALNGKGGYVGDFRDHDTHDGLWQGIGSDVDNATNSYVAALGVPVYSTTEPTNNNLWRVTTECWAGVERGFVRVRFYDDAAALIETIITEHTTTGAASVITTVAASAALDPAKEYHLEVSLKAGVGDVTAYAILYRITVEPLSLATASLPI